MGFVRRKIHEVESGSDAFLYFTEQQPDNPFYELGANRDEWEKMKFSILKWWIERHPGTRPHGWWAYDAPEPRKQLCGHGQIYPAFNVPSNLAYGMFAPFMYMKIDPENPPIFESQATYLKRLKLLVPGESRRIKKADYEPTIIEADNDG